MKSSTSDNDEVADFLATTDKETANAQVFGTKIEELAADIAAEEATEKQTRMPLDCGMVLFLACGMTLPRP